MSRDDPARFFIGSEAITAEAMEVAVRSVRCGGTSDTVQ